MLEMGFKEHIQRIYLLSQGILITQILNQHFQKLYQYVTFATRGENTLDLLYSNIKAAYKAVPQARFGSSDHLAIELTPVYKPLLKRTLPSIKEVTVWPVGSDCTGLF